MDQGEGSTAWGMGNRHTVAELGRHVLDAQHMGPQQRLGLEHIGRVELQGMEKTA